MKWVWRRPSAAAVLAAGLLALPAAVMVMGGSDRGGATPDPWSITSEEAESRAATALDPTR